MNHPYIRQFLSTHQEGLPYEGFYRWCHNHGTLHRIIETIAILLGIIGTIQGITRGSWIITLLGIIIALIGIVTFLFLHNIAPFHHDMKTHAFETARCLGSTLSYYGDIPILKINGTHQWEAGYAQGYLLGDAIHQMRRRFDFFLHTILRQARAESIADFLDGVKTTLPRQYVIELEGLVSGFNDWIKEQQKDQMMTFHEALLFHLMPDMHNLALGGISKNPLLRTEPIFGCTCLLDYDEKREPLFGRNLDWVSLGLMGKFSLVKFVDKGNIQTIEVSIPGLIGSLTGMNHHGFCLAMNVTPANPSNQIKGMPAVFYNRHCLESCHSVEDAVKMNSIPLTAFYLTVADPERGASFQFDNNEKGMHKEMRLLRTGSPLATFNRPLVGLCTHIDTHHSILREELCRQFYNGAQEEAIGISRRERLEAAMRLPGINNFETTHTVLMEPKVRRMRIAFDNAFAGDNFLHEVPTNKLFTLQRQTKKVT